jgi:parallel beta-helix repeat protein
LTGNNFEALSPETEVNGHFIPSNAIRTENNSYTTISHNTISNVNAGIIEVGSTCNNTINANSISTIMQAILVVSSDGNFSNASITDNTITGQGSYGIYLGSGNYNQVSGNVVMGTFNELMEFVDISHNTVFNNTLYSPETSYFANPVLALVLLRMSDSLFYHNNFLINDIAYTTASNVNWTNGYPSGGNYWAAYQGVDNFRGPYQNVTGSDGICDTCFQSTLITDAYPLMQPTVEVKPLPTPTVVPSGTPSTTNTMLPSITPTPTQTIQNKTLIDKVKNLLNLQVTGNITSTQMSNIALTTNQTNSSTTLSFIVTGPTGTTGFSNITIPKSAVPYGTSPIVTINGTQASNQGYTQDSSNYYIWYTTHFSTHQVSIIFATTTHPTDPTPSTTDLQNPAIGLDWVQIAILVLMGIIGVAASIGAFRFFKKERA